MTPHIYDMKKPDLILLPEIPISRGTRPTHANHPMSYVGKDRTSKSPDKTEAMRRRKVFNIFFLNT
jgi:hypothetical protein